MNTLGWIVVILICLPLIIWLFRVLIGFIGFCLGAVGLVMLFTGNIVPGIVLLVMAVGCGIIAPDPDPEDDMTGWEIYRDYKKKKRRGDWDD